MSTQLSDVNNRLRKTFDQNVSKDSYGFTEFYSTMTLSNARPRDTGYFGCTFRVLDSGADLNTKQYVYVKSCYKNIILKEN
jgi:hypothetical protein